MEMAAVTAAAELPTFELTGFPISPRQVGAGIGGGRGAFADAGAHVGQHAALPHQIAVLMLRVRVTETAAANFVRADEGW